jgi:hypothetical protein
LECCADPVDGRIVKNAVLIANAFIDQPAETRDPNMAVMRRRG